MPRCKWQYSGPKGDHLPGSLQETLDFFHRQRGGRKDADVVFTHAPLDRLQQRHPMVASDLATTSY